MKVRAIFFPIMGLVATLYWLAYIRKGKKF